MVRKATLDRGLRPDEFATADDAMGVGPDPAGLTERRPSHWRGAGGRWMVWAFRAVIWAVLLIIGFRGVEAIATSVKQPAAGSGNGAAPAAPVKGFPTGLAEAPKAMNTTENPAMKASADPSRLPRGCWPCRS